MIEMQFSHALSHNSDESSGATLKGLGNKKVFKLFSSG
jgi:hypothetical protein